MNKKEILPITIVKKLTPPESPGIHHRLLCLTGQSKGTSYYLKGKRLVIGRGESVELKISDPKSSREHAELVKRDDSYVLTDLGSQNGIMVNDLKVLQHELKDNDKIIIGKTVFKYNFFKIENTFTVSDEKEIAQNLIEEKSNSSSQEKKKINPVKLILIGLGLVAVYLFLFDSGDSKAPKKAPEKDMKDVSDSFTAILKQKRIDDEKEVKDKIAEHIHRGQREFREANYYRAMAEFNMALLLSPKHGNASYYLNKTKQALDNEIGVHFLKAKQLIEGLKYTEASVSYCSVIRLLRDYQEDQRYKDADAQLRIMEERLGLEKGEITCF